MVLAQVLLTALRRSDPDVIIDVLAPQWTLPIVRRMPEVRAAIASPFAHGELALRKRWHLGRALRKQNYVQAIVLPNSLKSALVPYFAGIPRRTGFRGEARYRLINDMRILDVKRMPRMIDRFLALSDEAVSESLQPRLGSDPDARERLLGRLGLSKRRPIAALCVGAEYGPAKRWPAGHFAALAETLTRAGWQCWLVGSEKDKAIADAVLQTAPGAAIDLCGATTLDEAIDLLAAADAVVANDSGLMHVAAALDKPLIALYGSSSPVFTPPLSDHAVIMKREIACSPCFARECPLGHFRCMRELAPGKVAETVISAVANRQR